MIEVTAGDPRVEIFRTMRNRVGEDGEFFIADGEKVVQRLLDSTIKTHSIFGLKNYIKKYNDKTNRKDIASQNIFVSSKSVMKEVLGYSIHQGFMALAYKPMNVSIPNLSNKIIVLNQVISSENTGSIIRSATAFGVDSILADHKSCHPYIRRSVRVSLGSIFSCKVSMCENLKESLLELKERGYTIIGSSSKSKGSIKITTSKGYQFPVKFALIIGNEGKGMEDEIVDVCDVLLQVPISNHVSSLNAASAATALLYQSCL